ncbi:MAG: hypothetical protein WAV09_01630 [Minisyncoccia bacterium]
MIHEYQKMQLPDEAKAHDIVVEVNWNIKDVKSNECQLIRFTFPNGDTALVKREHLNQVLFSIGDPEDQRKLLPQKIETVHHQVMNLKVKAKQDIKKGEEIILREIALSVPCSIAREVVGGANFQAEIAAQRAKDKTGLFFN